MKHILLTWKRQRRLKAYPEHVRQFLTSAEMVAKLGSATRIICRDISAVYKPLPRVTEFFATQDQTEHSRFKVIHLCGSLALCGHTPYFAAIHKAASSLGVNLREVEVEDVSEHRVYGKLDRMWYVLTDRKGVEEEGFELGVTVQTLASQLESRGSTVMYLLQKGPKRLLGVTAYTYEPQEDVIEAAEELQGMGITVEIDQVNHDAVQQGCLRIPDDISVTLPELVPVIRAAKELV